MQNQLRPDQHEDTFIFSVLPITLAYLTDLTGNPQGFSVGSVLGGFSLLKIKKESWFIGTPNFLENYLVKGDPNVI